MRETKQQVHSDILPVPPTPVSEAQMQRLLPTTGVSHQASSRTLLLTSVEEHELVKVDGLPAGAAATGPAAQDGLQQQHRLRQR